MAVAAVTESNKIEPAREPVRIGRGLAGQLYAVRYRGPRGMEPEVMVVAADAERAAAVARAWVQKEPGRIYLGCRPAIVADETILGPSGAI